MIFEQRRTEIRGASGFGGENNSDDNRLVVCFKPSPKDEVNHGSRGAEKRRSHFFASLPAHQFPEAHSRLESFERKFEGKLERKVLPTPFPHIDRKDRNGTCLVSIVVDE